jgi:hypothetical protein|tara:strand:- start:3266 stop:3463 length:198 start_codon:yes stop_codon:yes gene_type:complete
MLIYENKQAQPERFIYVRLKRSGAVVVHCKVRDYGQLDKVALLRQQFGEQVKINWTAEDHADVEV